MLASRGHDVTVFAGTTGSAAYGERRDGMEINRLPCSGRVSFHSVAVPALATAHARQPFDVVEAPDLYAEASGLKTTLPRLPLVLRAHTPLFVASSVDFHALPGWLRLLRAVRRLAGGLASGLPGGGLGREALGRLSFRAGYDRRRDPEWKVAAEADLVLPPSQRLAARLRRDWKLPPERVRVLPYAHLPSPALLALPLPEKGSHLGFHGGVRLFKGIHVLVQAMPALLARHPGLQLAIAGASGSSPVGEFSWSAWRRDRMLQWQDTVEWLGPGLQSLGGAVKLRGFVSPDRLPEHLACTDICVFPSLFDNFPSACLEAMSAGRAIVATRSGGMEEMLDHGRAGLLVPPRDPAALVAAVSRLVRDPVLRQNLAKRARARVLSEYSADAIGPRYEAAFGDAINRAHARHRV